MHKVYNISPDFSTELYRELNDDLKSFNDYNILEHYYIYGRYENRIYSYNIFYEKYPGFDVKLYKELYDDLKPLNDIHLFGHYHKYGCGENRFATFNKFYEKYPGFDVNLYRELYNDLRPLNDIHLFGHYHKYGCGENRFATFNKFYEIYPEFDVQLYRELYDDLKPFNDIQLFGHYHKYGCGEGRIYSYNTFCEKHPGFNMDLYKRFNTSLNNLVNINYINNNYLKFDFVVEHYDKGYDSKHPLYHEINNHYFYRKIKTYDELIEYNNNFKKNFIVYNKESFYQYYKGFDLDFYRNKYFYGVDISDEGILIYHHLEGRYKKNCINDKIIILIYTPIFDINCGGILAMHNLAKIINNYNNPKFIAKLFIINNIKYDNIFCTDFANIEEINDNYVVIYPETISGNPLNAKNVIRWILLNLGIEMPVDHYKNWGKNDLVYFWEGDKNRSNYKQLCCPWINPIFKNMNLERNKTCYLIKKGRFNLSRKDIHPHDSICIDNLSLEEIVQIFNESTYFYCYDVRSAFATFSVICGCIVILYPEDNISKEDYYKNTMYNKNNKICNFGIAYGNNKEEIEFTKNTINIAENKFIELYNSYYSAVLDLINDIHHFEIKENKVKNIFY
jgi:hypothetical protein